jgi:uncharacterized protein with HEPN domain
MNSRDRQSLARILEECTVIETLLSGYDFDGFLADERTKRAVCMTLINIGELVKVLSDDVRLRNKQIPWRAISGLRDITAHRYQSLRMEDIWETVKTYLPVMQRLIADLI